MAKNQKLSFETLYVDPLAAHQVIVMPNFGDVIDEDGKIIIPSAEEGDWQVWDNIPFQVPVIDIYGNHNLLKRRDATCKLIYSSLGTTANRVLTVERMYIAAENCQQELYQGAFRHWEGQPDIFQAKALELISGAAGTDLYTNKWFGYTGRPSNANWSLNKFDGIWHHVAVDQAAGRLAGTVDLGTSADFGPADAYLALIAMIDAQGDVMDNMDDDMKAFHIDKAWARLAWRYLVSIGEGGPSAKADAMPGDFMVENISVKPKKWNPLLSSIMGASAHAGILTLDGNFIYGTDSKYGSGPNSTGEALKVWYDETDDVTRWKFLHKAGTMLGAPAYAVVATTTGVLAQL